MTRWFFSWGCGVCQQLGRVMVADAPGTVNTHPVRIIEGENGPICEPHRDREIPYDMTDGELDAVLDQLYGGPN
jgi:hypothetical protein